MPGWQGGGGAPDRGGRAGGGQGAGEGSFPVPAARGKCVGYNLSATLSFMACFLDSLQGLDSVSVTRCDPV